jgi:DNA-binding NtrC family response regulator
MAIVLCVDDEPSVGAVLERSLAELGHESTYAQSVDEALGVLTRQRVDLVISDYRMPSSSGFDLLNLIRQQGVRVPVIIMTGYSSIEHAVLSMREGAVDYLTKPLRLESLRLAVGSALELDRLRRQNEAYRTELHALRGDRSIVGESAALQAALDVIEQVAPTRATVLLEGESGTGKELFARALHERSPRREEPFITLNCAALPEGLVESALFGHERGAFTGATARQPGAFERAHGGTLLLDEISEMRPDLQPKLLRAIQEQEFERVGGQSTVRVDVRIVATTNRDLRAEVEAGRFRQDLYFRLNVVPIRTPPLRERLEDLELLVPHFVAKSASRLGVRPPELRPGVIEALSRRPWPGNVRELENVVERAVILSRGAPIGPAGFDGPPPPRSLEAGAPTAPDAGAALPINLDALEAIAIRRALEASGGHRARAAALLGISERTLRNKLQARPAAG